MHSAERIRRLIQFSRRANFGRKKRLQRLAKKAFTPGVIKSALSTAGVAGVISYLNTRRQGYNHGLGLQRAAKSAALSGAAIGSIMAGGSAAGVVNSDARGGAYLKSPRRKRRKRL